jgi:hypothetical protein
MRVHRQHSEAGGWHAPTAELAVLLLAALRESLELNHVHPTAAEQAMFNERARLFLVDHERGKRVFVRFGETISEVGKSRPDGHFAGVVALSDRAVARLRERDESTR